MEVYEGEEIVQGYVVDQEMQETVVIPQAAVSAAAQTTEAPLPESPWNVEAEPRPDFEAAPAYNGPRPGYAFKTGPQGLGYYVDLTRDEQFRGCPQIALLFAQLPRSPAARGDGDSLRVWRGSWDAARRCVRWLLFWCFLVRRSAAGPQA